MLNPAESPSEPQQKQESRLTKPRFILASASPRRKALLAQIGIIPDAVMPARLDETPQKRECPRAYALRLAQEKAASIARELAESSSNLAPSLILGADTVVAVGRRILPKAEDEETARFCLNLLSGRRHRIFTALVLHPVCWPEGRYCFRVVESSVTFSRLTPAQIDFLLAQGDWQDKAGGYGLQNSAAAFIRAVSGSPSAVIGLPLFETAQLLRGQALPPGQNWIL